MPRLRTILTTLTIIAALPMVALAQEATPAAPPVSLQGVAPLPLPGERQAALADYVTTMLEKTRVPGAAVAVVQRGEVVYQQGFGVRELESSEPVTPETMMMIGSVTKSMTATHVDDGRLSWDTPVDDLLPQFALADPALTPRMALTDPNTGEEIIFAFAGEAAAAAMPAT